MLIVGSNKTVILDHLPERYLMIDDGPLIDQIGGPTRTVFDVTKHHFNPLMNIDYLRAVQLVEVFKAAYPEGENTLTKAAFEYQLLEALRRKPKSLATLIKDTKETQYAYQKVQRLLFSPVLESVLTQPPNFALSDTIHARLDRAKLGDFDAFFLGNLLAALYPGPVVITDFGFYAHEGHSSLIRQDRLIAGINSFDEVPALGSLLLHMPKVAARCTAEDAKIFALHAGKILGYNDKEFIEGCIA